MWSATVWRCELNTALKMLIFPFDIVHFEMCSVFTVSSTCKLKNNHSNTYSEIKVNTILDRKVDDSSSKYIKFKHYKSNTCILIVNS